MFLVMIPIIGWAIMILLPLALLVLLVIGILNAVNGKEAPLPLIGPFAGKFNI
jgi:uncharacterized membrane protein